MAQENFLVESNCSGNFLTFLVNQKSFQVLDLSLLSRDRSMPLDTLNLSETQENFFGNPRSMFGSSQTLYQGILHFFLTKCHRCDSCAGKYRATCRERWRTNSEHNINADVCRKAVNHEFHRILWLHSEDCEYWSCCSVPTPSTFECWKVRFKTQVSSCSDFPSEAMLRTKEVEMVDSVDDLRSSRSV